MALKCYKRAVIKSILFQVSIQERHYLSICIEETMQINFLQTLKHLQADYGIKKAKSTAAFM